MSKNKNRILAGAERERGVGENVASAWRVVSTGHARAHSNAHGEVGVGLTHVDQGSQRTLYARVDGRCVPVERYVPRHHRQAVAHTWRPYYLQGQRRVRGW